ncbi:phosphoadenosine phosphosulfate reductase family protein [Mucilaginibacter mali]|uniref:Phosphoadenosine phosphosulfate reductase family protein n=1 Tax=Mucilaginibacter mali TaxID=2740462 RepID=A0A7D4Q0L6_9SPHI|nr:phosphoadenosine phosphosulfate reductase family protein [Mucilaginibacter mali]QKJ28447.1 phosphoadenosine phosphosulfate reductase family protein [Mucilaginibacter mali]
MINFSGGKISALMTILLKPTPDDIVLFTDTGREHKKTYKFIDDFERYEGIKVHRVTYTHKKSPGLTGMTALNRKKVYLPNRVKRICTVELKILMTKRYLRSIGIQRFEQFIGFRADEQDRIIGLKSQYKKVSTRFILNEQGVTKPMVDQYWLLKPYTLEIPSILGNCDLCFLKGKATIIRILQLFPELAEPWIADEDEMSARTGKQVSYFSDITYRQLLQIAQSQKTLFDEVNLEKLAPAYSCSCTNF